MTKHTPTLLIVEDDAHTRDGIRLAFARSGFKLLAAANGREALEALAKAGEVDVVVSDMRMPEMGGMDLLRQITKLSPDTKVILLTAYGSVDNAVEAMKNGAFDFLTKPVNLDKLLLVVRRAEETRALERRHQALQTENSRLRKQLDNRFACPGILGHSREIRAVCEMIHQVAPSRVTVLIQGESGTGKELVARAIHDLGPAPRQPFVAVHCAALSEGLLESELFGHEKGSFTGAVARKAGRFELADGGTLFLDEISEINPAIQSKLLRALQFKEFERVGGTQTLKVDVRVITATNKILSEEVTRGRFREDLFYRLNVIAIDVPPLRARRDDIPELATAFVEEFNALHGKSVRGLSPEAAALCREFGWPGNVRQLRNCVERAVLFCRTDRIEAGDIQAILKSSGAPAPASSPAGQGSLSVRDNENELIQRALQDTRGNVSRAAKLLGISRRTLHRKLARLEPTPPA